MIMAGSMGAPLPFVLCGLIFISVAIGQAIYNFYNAGAKNRLSIIDIVSDNEEPDPLNERFGPEKIFCSACGYKTHDSQSAFCSKCGKQLA